MKILSDQIGFPIERNRYYYGKLLSSRDFEAEQDYNRNKQKLDHRLLNGAGVICGLGVSLSVDNMLIVNSGAALDYDGNEIVVTEPLLRSLPMLEGFRLLKGGKEAWLCLKYQETGTQQVRVTKTEDGKLDQFNKIREGFELYLSVEKPDYTGIFETMADCSSAILYSDDDLSVVMNVPKTVRAGEEFIVDVYFVKNGDIGQVGFSIEGASEITESDKEWLRLEYRQSPEVKDNVIKRSFKLKSSALSGITDELFPSGAELRLEFGSRQYRNFVKVNAPVTICRDREDYNVTVWKKENLDDRLSGSGLPIYLAKLELKKLGDDYQITSVTGLPFLQKVSAKEKSDTKGGQEVRISTSTRTLEYWQSPEVKADYFENTGTFSFDFGIPSPELHDYKISHGTIDIELPGGLRVNSRKVSEEIAHGLGPGNVDIRLSVECPSQNGETVLLSGNSEVFKVKDFEQSLPWVETAVVIYPERGTMRVGVWLHDTVPGNRLKIHYFAQKPEYDSERMIAGKKAEIRVIPEIQRVACGEKLKLKAVVTGSADTSVIWTVKDPNGGAVDRNGQYEAPDIPGTYEISAACGADEKIKATAFVIVE